MAWKSRAPQRNTTSGMASEVPVARSERMLYPGPGWDIPRSARDCLSTGTEARPTECRCWSDGHRGPSHCSVPPKGFSGTGVSARERLNHAAGMHAQFGDRNGVGWAYGLLAFIEFFDECATDIIAVEELRGQHLVTEQIERVDGVGLKGKVTALRGLQCECAAGEAARLEAAARSQQAGPVGISWRSLPGHQESRSGAPANSSQGG